MGRPRCRRRRERRRAARGTPARGGAAATAAAASEPAPAAGGAREGGRPARPANGCGRGAGGRRAGARNGQAAVSRGVRAAAVVSFEFTIHLSFHQLVNCLAAFCRFCAPGHACVTSEHALGPPPVGSAQPCVGSTNQAPGESGPWHRQFAERTRADAVTLHAQLKQHTAAPLVCKEPGRPRPANQHAAARPHDVIQKQLHVLHADATTQGRRRPHLRGPRYSLLLAPPPPSPATPTLRLVPSTRRDTCDTDSRGTSCGRCSQAAPSTTRVSPLTYL
jgi:hypothetical protein